MGVLMPMEVQRIEKYELSFECSTRSLAFNKTYLIFMSYLSDL